MAKKTKNNKRITVAQPGQGKRTIKKEKVKTAKAKENKALNQKNKRIEKRKTEKAQWKDMTPEEKKALGLKREQEKKERIKRKREEFEKLPVAQQKRIQKERRAKLRRAHYELEQTCAKLYATLIDVQKQGWNPTETVQKILDAIDQNECEMSGFCQTKIGSRVLQACLKWGSGAQRMTIADMVEANFHDIMLGKFSLQVLMKVFRYVAKGDKGTDAARMKKFISLVRLVKGKMLKKAFYHKTGCDAINQLYHMNRIPKNQQRRIINEIVVPNVIALQTKGYEPYLPLSKIFDLELSEKHRKELTEHLGEVCNRAIDKELLQFGLVQKMFAIYTKFASTEQLKDLMDRVVEGIPHLLASKDGVSAFLALLGVASAKHRKAIIRTLKGQWNALSTNEVDNIVLLRLLTTVDDTVLLNKQVMQELLPELRELCFDSVGRKVPLLLFAHLNKRYLTPSELAALEASSSTSMKAPADRQKELLVALVPQLKQVLMGKVDEDLKTSVFQFAADAAAKDVLIEFMTHEWDQEVAAALVVDLKTRLQDAEVANDKVVVRTLRTLLKVSAGSFATDLLSVFQGNLEKYLGSQASFVLMDLLKHAEAAEKIHAECKEKVDKLVEAGSKATTGGRQLLASVDENCGTDICAQLDVSKEEEEEKVKAAENLDMTQEVIEEPVEEAEESDDTDAESDSDAEEDEDMEFIDDEAEEGEESDEEEDEESDEEEDEDEDDDEEESDEE